MGQADKVFLNLAGEFAVASELNRRRVLASVTYGASKSADIFAMDENMSRLVRIEVKATDKNRWPVGHRAVDPNAISKDVVWLLVNFPKPLDGSRHSEQARGACAPRFYVLGSRELSELVSKRTAEYVERYQKRYGKKPDLDKGVPNITAKEIGDYEGRWETITKRLIPPSTASPPRPRSRSARRPRLRA
jgi:hypothetical protein